MSVYLAGKLHRAVDLNRPGGAKPAPLQSLVTSGAVRMQEFGLLSTRAAAALKRSRSFGQKSKAICR